MDVGLEKQMKKYEGSKNKNSRQFSDDRLCPLLLVSGKTAANYVSFSFQFRMVRLRLNFLTKPSYVVGKS